MGKAHERIEELLDELFDSTSEAIRYLEGMKRDMSEGTYDMSRLEGDIDFIEARFSVESIMKELLEARDITEEIKVDVWSHFSKAPS
jgi:hypothetical protein